MAARAQAARTPDTTAASSAPPAAERAPRSAPVAPIGCPCGGGCPRCATQARHGAAGRHEAEARVLGARILVAPARERSHAAATPPAAPSATASHGERRRHRARPATAARAPPRARHPAVRSGPAPDGIGGHGMPLSAAERERFEPLLGLDLGAVRVHAGASAEALARDHRAHAFTYGSHVVLGRGARTAGPGARARILAHELVHVGQQAAPAISGTAPHRPRERAPPGVQRLPDDDTSIVPAFLSEAAGAVAELGAGIAESAE